MVMPKMLFLSLLLACDPYLPALSPQQQKNIIQKIHNQCVKACPFNEYQLITIGEYTDETGVHPACVCQHKDTTRLKCVGLVGDKHKTVSLENVKIPK